MNIPSYRFQVTRELMYIDRMEERIFVYAETLRGLLNGKTIADLQSAINALGVNIDLHTKNHPEGELRGTIRIQGS